MSSPSEPSGNSHGHDSDVSLATGWHLAYRAYQEDTAVYQCRPMVVQRTFLTDDGHRARPGEVVVKITPKYLIKGNAIDNAELWRSFNRRRSAKVNELKAEVITPKLAYADSSIRKYIEGM